MKRLAFKIWISSALFAAIICSSKECIYAKQMLSTQGIPSLPDKLIRLGVDLEHKQKWQKAIPYFKECVNIKPELEIAWVELGRCYMMSKDYINAKRTLTEAYKRFATPVRLRDVLLQLMHNEGEAGHLEALQHWRKEFVKNFPSDKYAATIREEIEFYEGDFAATRKREASQNLLRLEGFYPWLQLTMMPAMPIKVCIAPEKLGGAKYTKAVCERYSELAKSALAEWAAATDHYLQFRFVDNPKDAQLRVLWTTETKERAHSFYAGQAQYIQNATQGPVSTKAEIFVEPNKVMSDSIFYEICLHEVGHALGLQHTSNPKDVMYGAAATGAKLSTGDIKVIRGLYADPFLGKAVAESFANAAFVNKEYDKAYALLSAKQRATTNLEQFQQAVEDAHANQRPLSVEVNHFERTSQRTRSNFALLGNNQAEKFYYHVSVVIEPNEEFKVEQWNRIRAN